MSWIAGHRRPTNRRRAADRPKHLFGAKIAAAWAVLKRDYFGTTIGHIGSFDQLRTSLFARTRTIREDQDNEGHSVPD